MRKNGDIIYEGDFVNNNFEGKGTLNKRGILYKGEFKNGLEHGKGTIYLNNIEYSPEIEGDGINREFVEGLMQYAVKGDYYLGEFKNGMVIGKGTLYDKNGNVIFENHLYSNIFKEMMELMLGIGLKKIKTVSRLFLILKK